MKGLLFEEREFPDNCIGCRTCELVCSFAHEALINSEKARIRVVKEDRYGCSIPIVCIQCASPTCAEACPVNAIGIEKDIVVVNEDTCIGCGACTRACPIGAIRIHPATGKAFKCDLCGGGVAECVSWCPRNVLRVRYHSEPRPTFDVAIALADAITAVSRGEDGDGL